MAVALAVGGWFASKAVSMLCDSIAPFITDWYQVASGVKSKLQSLERSLRKIEGVIRAVERKCLTEDPAVVSWLNDLKDGIYDAEDILDFFNYESLRRSVESSGSKSEGRSSSLVNLSRKFVKQAKIGAKRAFSPDDSLYDLSDIVNKFDRLSNDAQIGTFLKVVEMNTDNKKEDESFDRRQTSPVLAEATVFGRSKEKDKLRDNILDKNGSNGEKFSVVSIVGIGGVGKTTLAQWLFNREDVKNHFNLQAWVCTSGKSDMGTVMISIIEYATKLLYNRINFACIHEDLLRLLCEKRFLIVLDDVCDEIINQWDKLISVFRHGKEGSKIIITSRNRKVTNKVNSMDDGIYLEGLGKEEYWELFRCCGFGNVNPKDHPKLEHIGQQIASKLGGLPLAAKTVGGILKERLEERHWRDVLENKEWQEEGEILPSLRMSYNLLPPYLKQCFVYCALFPKDYYFDKRKLVHIWVAQGFVQSSHGTKTLEDIGRKYFDELYSRSFFQDAARHNWYVIHDLLHDLAELVFADEIYKVEITSLVELNISKRVRHLFISSNDLDRVLAKIEEPKKLRSLVCDRPYTSNTSNISQTSCLDFKKLQGLRLLMLPGEFYSLSHLPETIGNMIHLRYLECPFGTKLPISLGRLYNLQVLELSYSCGINHEHLYPDDWFSFLQSIDDFKSPYHCLNDQTTMSKIFCNLTNLRYINAPWSFISAIPSIGRLTSLQRLMHYEVREQEGCRISELRNLNKIRGYLRIDNLENVADKEEAKMVELHNKVHLEALSLWWNKSKNCSNDEVRVQEEVLEGLQPHSNIKGIGILRYMGLKHPSWLNKSYLSNIEYISLFACGCLKALPPLGEFPFLKYLFLNSLMSLEKIGGGGVFQSLQHLRLEDLEELREWLSIKEDVGEMMPHLCTLEITRCNKLEALPPLGGLQCLKHLVLEQLDSVRKIGMETYGRESVVFPELYYLKLSSIKQLKEWLAPDNGQSLMLHLTALYIINCSSLKVIPPLGELPSLKSLHLEGLDLLEEIGIEIYGHGSVAFPSLGYLYLVNLKELKKWSGFKEDVGDMMPHLSWLKIIECNKLETLPPIGGLQCLEQLALEQLDSLTEIEIETNGRESTVLPKLDYLELSSIKELKQWLAPHDGQSLMPHVTCLLIINCPNLKIIPPFGELPLLEYLQLEGLASLEEIGIAVEEQGRDLMPRLRRLRIIDCLKLRRPIQFTSSLEDLTFSFSKTVDGMQMFHKLFPVGSLTRLKRLSLGPLTGLDSFTDAQQEWFQSLTSLEALSFEDCGDMWSLPDVLESLCHLERLELGGCPKMVSLGQNNLPKNLEDMRISECGELNKRCDWRQDGREWSKICHIPHIEIEGEVIPYPTPAQCSRGK